MFPTPAVQFATHSMDYSINYVATNTPNANMADHSVGALYESHESEASWAFMFCFDNVSPEKACFVVNLVCFNFAVVTSCCVSERREKGY